MIALVPAIAALISALAPVVVKLIQGHVTEADARKQAADAVAQFQADLDASIAGDAQRDAETAAALAAVEAGKPHPHGPAPVKIDHIEGLDLLGGGDKTGGSLL